MTRRRVHHRRGLTLLELMLALSVTALVGAGIAGMLEAVTTGIDSKRDNRRAMICANAAQTRLSAYVAPSRAVLDVSSPDLVLWLGDFRESDTVHATEIRWLIHNATDETVEVHFVRFPEGWTQAMIDLADLEYASDSNWWAVYTTYAAAGHVAVVTLVDRVADIAITTDAVKALDTQHLNFDLDVVTSTGRLPVQIATTIRLHDGPSS